MDREEMLRRAREAGLAKAVDDHADDVVAAYGQALDIAGKLRRDIDPRAEPAHVYRIPTITSA